MCFGYFMVGVYGMLQNKVVISDFLIVIFAFITWYVHIILLLKLVESLSLIFNKTFMDVIRANPPNINMWGSTSLYGFGTQ
jgi:hypothetical protein